MTINRDSAARAGIRRRDVLALPLVRALPISSIRGLTATLPVAAGLALAPKVVKAEPVTTCLAVASAVAGLIAAHNRSDGGMGAVMSATLDYQRVMVKQLASLQEGMAEVLVKLSALPEQFRELLYRERLATLHSNLGKQVLRYQAEVMLRAGTFTGGYQAWTGDSLTRSELTDISGKISDSVADVRHGYWLDAMTALYLPPSVFSLLGVRSALGESPEQQAAQAQRYLDLFDLIEDPDEPSSVAADLVSVTEEIHQVTGQLAKLGFLVREEDDAPPQEVVAGRVAVQDYTPRTLAETRTECRPGPGPDKAPICREISTYHPERFGQREVLGFFATVTPSFVEASRSNGEKVSVRTYQVSKELVVQPAIQTRYVSRIRPPEVRTLSSISRYLSDTVLDGISVLLPPPEFRIDARTQEARRAAAKASPHFSEAVAVQNKLSLTVDRLNILLARSALDAAALTAVSSTRQSLFRYFGREG